MATDKQIAANRQNAQLSTGPKTDEGKMISSMNNLKHGYDTKNFFRIRGKAAGNLKICDTCGNEQKALCRVEEVCLLWDQLALAYIRSHQTKNTKYIEEVNIVQLATVDLIFTQQLRYAQQHLHEMEEYTDEDGNKREKPKIDTGFLYMLMNFMQRLSKGLPDMQLTRNTQENIDVAWAELARADVSQEKAEEFREKILIEMEKFRLARGQAQEMEMSDEAIQQFRQIEKESNEDSAPVTVAGLGRTPFGTNDVD